MMIKAVRYLGISIVAVLVAVLVAVGGYSGYLAVQSSQNIANAGSEAPTLDHNGFSYRDLNKNGRLDAYENSGLETEARVDDILSQMTLEEKAGMMFITMIGVGMDGGLQEFPDPGNPFTFAFPSNSDYVVNKLMNHFNVMATPEPGRLVAWQNNLQKLAERTRLGIPITIASDPRHAFGYNPAASISSEHFSLWPEPLGLAAARDAEMVEAFGDIARQEYLSVGIRLALHPMADLATEPRWARAAGTFGEDAELSAKTVYAYVKGFQGDELGPDSVATMVKHFSGGGPQKDGEDAHFTYGKEQVYPGDNFDYHLIPFEKGAFAANAAQIMPYYGIPVSQTSEDVGFAFNKEVMTGMLRDKYGFDGVICSDWGLITEFSIFSVTILEARAWGVEHLNESERALKMLDAGVDQFGGENIPEIVVELVRSGQVEEDRIDQSIRRLLRDKFTLGLFDDPFLDPDEARKVAGSEEFRKAGISAQRKSLVLLKNPTQATTGVLPLTGKPKIYIENIDPAIAGRYGQVVESRADADFAIVRVSAPYEHREGLFESFMHAGDLDFKGVEKQRLIALMDEVPTIVDIYLDRAAVIPEISEKSAALIANFGATDGVLLDAIFGKFSPTGKLPFEMPSSMDAVRKQKEDVPYDSVLPLFTFGHGLTYPRVALNNRK